MKYYVENNLADFDFWGGAVDTADTLRELDDVVDFDVFGCLEAMMEDDITEWSETGINDFFWFEDDTIAEWLGYSSWEGLERVAAGKPEEPFENEYVIGEDVLYQNEHFVVKDFDEDTGYYTIDKDGYTVENVEEDELDYWEEEEEEGDE